MAYVIRRGYTGLAVKKMQHYLNVLRTSYPDLPVLKEDGSFGSATENAVMIFQKHTGLTADGIIGTLTWDKIIAKYKAAPGPGPDPDPDPGTEQPPLEYGDTGLEVQKMQNYLNKLTLPSTPITADGVFGAKTEAIRAAPCFKVSGLIFMNIPSCHSLCTDVAGNDAAETLNFQIGNQASFCFRIG